MPQILKKCGIDYFMTTKLAWNEFNKVPYDTMNWEGIDGAPKVVKEGASKAEAEDIKTKLEAEGAKVTLK